MKSRNLKPSDVWPEGRTLYYEGDEPHAFIEPMQAQGIRFSIVVDVPGDKIDAIYGDDSPWQMGS